MNKETKLDLLVNESNISLMMKKDFHMAEEIREVAGKLSQKHTIMLYEVLEAFFERAVMIGELSLDRARKETARKKGRERRKIFERIKKELGDNLICY